MRFKKWMFLPAAYAVLETIAFFKRGDSVYDNDPEEKNPLQGQMVKFIEDENDPENADGGRGHLISVGQSNQNHSVYDKYIKRGLDKALSFAGLVILAPVYAGISLAIYIDDPGTILFTQKRVGKDKEYFKLHKFRSMKMSTPHDVPTHMLDNPESYITRVGGFLRAHSLDELPQIWDIFIGNMSIIGPRPALWNQDLLTAERDKYRANNLRPGLTGWAQINGRDTLTIPEKAFLDGEYLKKLSCWFDIICFLRTLHVFNGDKSIHEGSTQNYDDCQSVFFSDKEFTRSIAGKKILLFSPFFFDYQEKIAEKMTEMGADVDLFDERSVDSALDKAFLKVFPSLFTFKSKRYYNEILDICRKDYDYILIIKCDMTPVSTLKQMRKQYPNAKMCLYLWDSLENISGIHNKLKYFDSIHSFDLEDCKQYDSLLFRPLFYSDEYKTTHMKQTYKYDICFAGTIHSDRYEIIQRIKNQAEAKGMSYFFFCYLQSRFIYYFYKMYKPSFKKASIKDFSFLKKDTNELTDIISQSRIVLDIQHPNQTGLTMRTIEMIGMNKKLITTNASITQYDFYDSNNIYVIDRHDNRIDDSFLKTDYRPINENIYEKYSLRNWILDVLS